MCGPNPRTGYNYVEELSKLLEKLAKEEESLIRTPVVCNQIIEYWNNLKEHVRSPTKLWGNTMFDRTKGAGGLLSCPGHWSNEKQTGVLCHKTPLAVWWSSFNFDFIECFTTTFLHAHSWLNWVVWWSSQEKIHKQGPDHDEVWTPATQCGCGWLRTLEISLAKIISKCVRKCIPKQEALAAVNASAQILGWGDATSGNYYFYTFDHIQGV